VSRAAGRALLFLFVLASLSACRIYSIFGSGAGNTTPHGPVGPSSGDPAQGLITNQVDLAAEIPAAAASSFTLSVTEDYGQEYIVLATDMSYVGTHVWLMDPSLNVLLTWTDGDLAAGGFPISGSRAWFDAWHLTPHRLIIGNQLFILTPPGSLGWIGWSLPQAPGQSYFAEHAVGDYNVAGISVTGNTLQYSTYPDTWGTPTPVTATIGPSTSYSLLAVFSDGNATDTAHKAAYFVFRDLDTGTDHFVKIPWTSIMGSISQPLLGSYELFSKPSSSELPASLGYAGGAFLVFRPGSGSTGDFIRFDETGAALAGSLHYENLPDMQVAYSLTGTHYFTFDRASRVLSRRSGWW